MKNYCLEFHPEQGFHIGLLEDSIYKNISNLLSTGKCLHWTMIGIGSLEEMDKLSDKYRKELL